MAIVAGLWQSLSTVHLARKECNQRVRVCPTSSGVKYHVMCSMQAIIVGKKVLYWDFY